MTDNSNNTNYEYVVLSGAGFEASRPSTSDKYEHADDDNSNDNTDNDNMIQIIVV